MQANHKNESLVGGIACPKQGIIPPFPSCFWSSVDVDPSSGPHAGASGIAVPSI